MSEPTVYRTLSSSSRLQMLRLLYREPLSVEEIAGKMNLRAVTVRHHLQVLVEAGIVEYHEERSGAAGRPRAYYSVVKSFPIVCFPPRQYLLLSETLINALVRVFGKNKTATLLEQVGFEMGEDIVRRLESECNIKSWSMRDFEEHFIKGCLKKEGTEPEIVETSEDKIVFRVHNCPFFELALRMPEIICDILHQSFHDGIAKSMDKNMKLSRSSCAGHGDLYCEHICTRSSQNRLHSRNGVED